MKKFIKVFLLSSLFLTSNAYSCSTQNKSENFEAGCMVINQQMKNTRCQKKIEGLKLIAEKAGCKENLKD